MNNYAAALVSGLIYCWLATGALAERVYEKADPPKALTPEQTAQAAANYQKYCALCHGEDRQGYVNDNAPSLRSSSLLSSGLPSPLGLTIAYGRDHTPMAAYLDEVGGPMTIEEIKSLTYWLFFQQPGVQRIKLSSDVVSGDVQRGAGLFAEHCASCHGADGEGVNAPALANTSALFHNSDQFIRYAIEQGRDGTPMQAWGGRLSAADLDSLTAFIRRWGTDRAAPERVTLRQPPTPDEYVLNPAGEEPEFTLMQDSHYISSAELDAAIKAKKRMLLLDTRAVSAWQRAHIEGAVPFPYYSELEDKVTDLPKDVMIVLYCACPRAAADYVVKGLKELGYERMVVLYDGLFGWIEQGYPYLIGGAAETASR
ncbi:MAG: c-type cytochrome [Parahaliea sp.]